MPSPLATGQLPYPSITARLLSTPFPGGRCPASLEEIGRWVATFAVQFDTQVAFGYSAGTVANATPESRTFPRFLFSTAGTFMGLAIWDTTLASWTIGGALGELKIVVRSATTVVQDMADKNFTGTGWHLADGTTTGIPDLTANDGFFTGTGPNWDIYTIGYTGT